VNGNGPVDPYGWSGSFPDPYPKDAGDLWISGSPRFADVPLPHHCAVPAETGCSEFPCPRQVRCVL